MSLLNSGTIKIIIFDLDGVLYDSTMSWIKTERKIAKQLAVLIPKRKAHWQLFGKSAKERIKILFPKEKQEKAKKLFFDEERENFLLGFKLFPDCGLLLKYLKNKNIKVAIATGLDRNALNRILTKDKLWKFIDTTATAEEIGKEKPNPEILTRILEKFKIKSAEALYVGDAISDIETAKRAKIKVAIITRGAIRNKKEAQEFKADYVFSNFSELLNCLKSRD